MRSIAGYVRRHHIGLVALFVALGGTAYAVQKAPKDSVVSKSIKDGQVKVRDVQPAKTVEFPAQVSVPASSFTEQEPFTVKVPRSGFISVYGEAQIRKVSGSFPNPCSVGLSLDGDVPYTPILSIPSTIDDFTIRRTSPNSDNEGVFTNSQAGLLTFPVDPGKQTFGISYASSAGTSCQFRNTRLVIVPLP
jgi:hypothetical protein